MSRIVYRAGIPRCLTCEEREQQEAAQPEPADPPDLAAVHSALSGIVGMLDSGDLEAPAFVRQRLLGAVLTLEPVPGLSGTDG